MIRDVAWPWTRAGEDPATYLNDVYRYARARLGSREDAEDVACEVVQSLPTPCVRKDLRLYMLGMARRKVADRLRRRMPTVTLLESDLAPSHGEDVLQTAAIDGVLAVLPDDQRDALILKYVVGFSSRELGSLLGRSPEAIDSLLQRGRAAFAQEWNAHSSDEEKL